jgi:transposase
VFIRRNPGRKGAVSVQLVEKVKGKIKVLRTFGTSSNPEQIDFLYSQAKAELIKGQMAIFPSHSDSVIEAFLKSLSNSTISVIGPELIFGKVFDSIGFSKIDSDIFRHLVISRLVFPGSKLRLIEYLRLFRQVELPVDQVYRFLDQMDAKLKGQAEAIVKAYSQRVLGDSFTSIFYDVTTLHFESEQEDDLRQPGYSKAGKHENPQILLGLLVGQMGYPLAWEIFEGSRFEGHTFIEVLDAFTKAYSGKKPVVIADAGLLSAKNIEALKTGGYQFILGARIRNESETIRNRIIHSTWKEDRPREFGKSDGNRLIVSYSKSRSKKDAHNRNRGLQRLEKAFAANRLTKEHINQKGYNRYLKLKGDTQVEIDHDAFKRDSAWDGLKGYVTNSKVPRKEVIAHYQQLFHIEAAFRMSKTDLKIRPIYHRLERRIRAHITIAFCAYTIMKETERIIRIYKIDTSVSKIARLAQTIYQIKTMLPDSKKEVEVLLKLTPDQQLILDTFDKT